MNEELKKKSGTMTSEDQEAFVGLLEKYNIMRCSGECGGQLIPIGSNWVCKKCGAGKTSGCLVSRECQDDAVKRVEKHIGCAFPDYLVKDPIGWISFELEFGEDMFEDMLTQMKKEILLREKVKSGVPFERALTQIFGSGETIRPAKSVN